MGSTWGHPKAARRLSHHKCPETCVATTFTIWQQAPRKHEHSQATRTPSTRGRQGRRGLWGPGGSRHSHSPVGKGRPATAVSCLLPQHSHPAGVRVSEQPQPPKIPEKASSESRGLEGTGVLQTRVPGNHEGALTTPGPQQSQTLPRVCTHRHSIQPLTWKDLSASGIAKEPSTSRAHVQAERTQIVCIQAPRSPHKHL